MCEVLEVSKSGFYDWMKRGSSENQSQSRYLKIIRDMEDIQIGVKRTYGSPRMLKMLKGLGHKIGKSKVEELMRENNLNAKTKKRYKVQTTQSNHSYPVAANLLNRNFTAFAPNQIWVADITYIETKREGWAYLATILDLFSRKIVGWSLSKTIDCNLTVSALKNAILTRKPPRGLIHHSDRGTQYAAYDYQEFLAHYGIICSMSRVGNCYDNAVMESFYHTLKTEHVYHQTYQTFDEAKTDLFQWIEIFYNRKRIHSSLGYKTPVAMEEQNMLLVA